MITYEFTNYPNPTGETFYNIALASKNATPAAIRQQTYVNMLSRAAERAAEKAPYVTMPSAEIIVAMAAALTQEDEDVR